MSRSVSLYQGERHLQPVSIRRAQRDHGPIAAPHDALGAEAAKYACDEGIQLRGTGAWRSLGQQSGQLAMEGGTARELLDLAPPGFEGPAGNIRFAAVIQHCHQGRMAPQTPLEHL